MPSLAEMVEQQPQVAKNVFSSVEQALNQVLPGSDVHARYVNVDAVGLAVAIGRTTEVFYSPIDNPGVTPSFIGDNQEEHPDAWEPLPADSEFLDEEVTDFGRFVFFALAKMENMLITGKSSSYDPYRTAIIPGRVGYAGGRRLFSSFISASGLWEAHDHLVSGAVATEVAAVANEVWEPRTSDDFAEYFEREFARIQALHQGVAAADISHRDIGRLLPMIDCQPSRS